MDPDLDPDRSRRLGLVLLSSVSLQCLYCEKTFRDKSTLRDHMRKKSHRRISASNHQYDRFYVINYLVKAPPGRCGPRPRRSRLSSSMVPVASGVGEDLGGGAERGRRRAGGGRARGVGRPGCRPAPAGTPLTRPSPPQRLVGLASSPGGGRLSVLPAPVGDHGADLRTHAGTGGAAGPGPRPL